MVADLCHVVLSCFRGEKAKKRHAKTRQIVTFSCFRMATYRTDMSYMLYFKMENWCLQNVEYIFNKSLIYYFRKKFTWCCMRVKYSI